MSWIDLVVNVGGHKAFGELTAAVTRVTFEAALPILLSTLVVFGVNLSVSRSLLIPERHRHVVSIASLAAIAAGYLAAANLGATAVEPATLMQILVTAAAVQFEVARHPPDARHQPDTFAATLPFVFINAFVGIYLVNVPPTFTAVAPALAALGVYCFARVADSTASQWRLVAAGIAIGLSVIILAKSLIEYEAGKSVAYAPRDSPWRSLYFAIVLTGYAAVALSYRSASTPAARRRAEANLWLASAMLCAIPLLICFTPHGLVLALSSALWLVAAFVVCRSRFARRRRHWRWEDAAVAILFLLVLFVLLTADRLVHIDPTAYLSPVIFLPEAWGGAIGLVFGAVLPVVLASISGTRKWILGQVESLRHLPGGKQVIVVVGASFALLAVCFLFYAAAAAYTQNGPSNVFDLKFATPPIEGFGGVNALSWAAVAFALNLLVFAGVRIATTARRLVREGVVP